MTKAKLPQCIFTVFFLPCFTVILGLFTLTLTLTSTTAFASTLVTQSPLPAADIPKYVDPLPIFGPSGMSRVDGTHPVTVRMEEYAQQVLPTADAEGNPTGFGKTSVWAYKVGDAPIFYPGVTLEVERGTPTDITYVNDLPSWSEGGVVQGLLSVDQSIHWSDPLESMCPLYPDGSGCKNPYTDSVPAVVHLHGAEVQSDFDGTPDQWFTPNGRNGVAYRSYDPNGPDFVTTTPPAPGTAVYHYTNGQEATTLWFHDHALGITRLHVYAGLEAFYLIRDKRDTGRVDNPIKLPGGDREIEMVIQDRQFDTTGQWYFPDGSNDGLNGTPPNPEIHPFWIPEFLGDAIVVNGKTWPYLDVKPMRYRFRFLNASNARFFNMFIPDGPAFWQIGTDGGLLDTPVKMDNLLMAPAERDDVIIDFSGYAGQTLTIMNDANSPYPDGDPVDPQTNGQIMQFRVAAEPPIATSDFGRHFGHKHRPPQQEVDQTCDPAAGKCRLRDKPMVRLAEALTGPGKSFGNSRHSRNGHGSQGGPDLTRQLTLNEEEGPGGPAILMLNNTRWNGQQNGFGPPVSGAERIYGTPAPSMHDTYASELPRVGSTEVWELVNISADAHPIHLHLVQFQILNRQVFDTTAYLAAYAASFPSGAYTPEVGPPNDYMTPNADGAVGGNPAVSSYLQGSILPPDPNENGWKDTIKAYPGMITRIVVRFAPQDVPVRAASPGDNYFLHRVSNPASAFDATVGPGYVWHCHILDHEDNEMMRPYAVRP